MQLYCGTTTQFVEDTLQNRIIGRLENAFFAHFRYRPSSSEVNSWRNSLGKMCSVVQYAHLEDNGLVLEHQFPDVVKALGLYDHGSRRARSCERGDRRIEAMVRRPGEQC